MIIVDDDDEGRGGSADEGGSDVEEISEGGSDVEDISDGGFDSDGRSNVEEVSDGALMWTRFPTTMGGLLWRGGGRGGVPRGCRPLTTIQVSMMPLHPLNSDGWCTRSATIGGAPMARKNTW